MRRKLFPNGYDEVFNGTYLPCHKTYINIQVLVVKFFRDVFLDDIAQFLHVIDKTGIRVGVTLDGNVQVKIMAMPVFVSTFSKHLFIALPAPVWIEEPVRRVEMFYPGDINHWWFREIFRKGKPKNQNMGCKCEICSMRILVIAATENEVDVDNLKKTAVEFLVTGVGVPATIYQLQKRLQQDKPGMVIQAGIAGSFGDRALGEVVLVKQDVFADLGMEEQGEFRTVFDSGFADKDAFPFTNGWLVNSHPLLAGYHLPSVPAVTVNKVTDSQVQRRQLVDSFSPAVETMEGAALHYVCLMENIPFIQVRGISNLVGERDKLKWRFREAIANLNREMHQLITAVINRS